MRLVERSDEFELTLAFVAAFQTPVGLRGHVESCSSEQVLLFLLVWLEQAILLEAAAPEKLGLVRVCITAVVVVFAHFVAVRE